MVVVYRQFLWTGFETSEDAQGYGHLTSWPLDLCDQRRYRCGEGGCRLLDSHEGHVTFSSWKRPSGVPL